MGRVARSSRTSAPWRTRSCRGLIVLCSSTTQGPPKSLSPPHGQPDPTSAHIGQSRLESAPGQRPRSPFNNKVKIVGCESTHRRRNRTGDLARAERLYQEALGLARETRQADAEAHALEGSGECRLSRGGVEAGVADLQQALEIFDRLAMRLDADRIRARLAALTGGPESLTG